LTRGGADVTSQQRSTTDCSGSDPGAPSIHLIYALPADGEDRGLDLGPIAVSVASGQRWLRAQAGGRQLRLDEYEGSYDVTFARLSRSGAELKSEPPSLREKIEAELGMRGFDRPHKRYLVYYDGSHDTACGQAAYPPHFPGRYAVMFLKGDRLGAVPCEMNALAASPGATPGYWEYAALHDTLHALGLVARGAPREHMDGHVDGPPDDLMYRPPPDLPPWRFPCRLDPGRDSYYEHGRTDVLDLATSPYLTAA